MNFHEFTNLAGVRVLVNVDQIVRVEPVIKESMGFNGHNVEHLACLVFSNGSTLTVAEGIQYFYTNVLDVADG